MLTIADIQLAALATHYVGNKANGEDIEITKELVDIESADLRQTLLQYFFTPFQETESWNFWHPTDLKLHELAHFTTEIFSEPDALLRHSISIARHLYDAMNLPNIKSGELHIAYFRNCPVNGRMTDAIGIYKTESKDRFIKLTQDGKRFVFQPEEGINPNRMDKGCLIFNTNEDNGYQVHIIDKTNKGGEAQFWKDTFLKVRAAADEYHHTADYLKMCKDFIMEQVPQEYEVNRVEQVDFLNKSLDYFKKNEQFDKAHFQEQVFRDPGLIDSFQKFEKQYQEDYELDIADQFDISSHAVKKQGRVYKSVIKLDKNFHVYVHGDKDLIEKGYDPQVGMNYYKIYFEEES